MAKRMMGPKGSTRRRRFLFVPLLLAACIALFVVAGAQAVHDTTLFQLDGNALSTRHVRSLSRAALRQGWTTGTTSVTRSTQLPVRPRLLTRTARPPCRGARRRTRAARSSPAAAPRIRRTSRTGPGRTPAACRTRTTSSTASRRGTRCRRTRPTARRQTDGSTNCDVLFFGSDRFDNSGDAQQGFWFFQNKVTLGKRRSAAVQLQRRAQAR